MYIFFKFDLIFVVSTLVGTLESLGGRIHMIRRGSVLIPGKKPPEQIAKGRNTIGYIVLWAMISGRMRLMVMRMFAFSSISCVGALAKTVP